MVWNEKLKREIPVLWEAKLVDDIAEVFNGATPSTTDEQNYGGNIVWITPKDLSDQKHKFVYNGERNISQKGYDSCSTHLLPINTILMSSRAPIGLLAIAKTELCTNQGFKNFVSKEESLSTYLYYYLQTHIKKLEQLGTGTTFKEISREEVLNFPILRPNNETLNLWKESVTTINDRQLELQKENENLTKLRDSLLPLLMKGQVSVNYDLASIISQLHDVKKAYFTNHRGRQVTKFVYICAEEDSTRGKGSGRWDKSRRLLSRNSAVFHHSGGVFARGRPPHVGVPSGARPLARHALADSAAPLQIPRPKTAKCTFGGGGTRLIYSDTPQPESKLPLPPVPLPPFGRRAIVHRTRSAHRFTQSAAWFRAVGTRLRAVSATARHRPFARLAQPVHHPTPPGRLPTQPVLPPRPPRSPKHGSRGRCPPLPSDSGV